MSHYMTALAMKQKGLKPAAKIVLYWIADHHNGETGQCNPSIKRLAECCEMSRRSVENHITALANAGLIEVKNAYRENGGKTSNSYTLCFGDVDAQNLRKGSAKSAQGDLQNLRMKNLVRKNLGIEPRDIAHSENDRFDEFWSEVSRKIGKGQARKAWTAALKKADADTIITGIRRYAAERRSENPKFTAHPATWLNGERWEDERPKPKPRKKENWELHYGL